MKGINMTNTQNKNFILVANEDEANQIGSLKNIQVIIIGEGRSKVNFSINLPVFLCIILDWLYFHKRY